MQHLKTLLAGGDGMIKKRNQLVWEEHQSQLIGLGATCDSDLHWLMKVKNERNGSQQMRDAGRTKELAGKGPNPASIPKYYQHQHLCY